MEKVKYGFIKKPRMNKFGAPEGIILYKVKIISETDIYYNVSYVGVVINGEINKINTKYLKKQVYKDVVFDIFEVEESWLDKILNLKIFELI